MKKLIVAFSFLIFFTLHAERPSDAVMKSNIACAGILSDVTLLELENYLLQIENVVDYEIYNNKEIILISKRIDNLLKKTIISKFQFKFSQEGNESVLLLINALLNDKVLSSQEIYIGLISQLSEAKKDVEIKKAKSETRVINNRLRGDFKGFFLYDGDESDEKMELKVTFDFFNESENLRHYNISLDGKSFPKDTIFIDFYKNIDNYFFNKSDSIRFGYEHHYNQDEMYFEGLFQNDEIHGTGKITKTKSYPVIGDVTKTKKGTFKLTKIK